MEEYIDKNKIPWVKTDNPKGKYWDRIVCESTIKNMEPADVIERFKIDKAIEVFRKEIEENHLNVIDYADEEWLVKDFIYGAIDRLKRNIRE